MTARDQLADRIVPILDPDALDPVAQEQARNVADAVIGMVLPLEWRDHPINGEPVLSMAKVNGGAYFICDDTDDFTGLYCEFISCKDATWYGSVTASTTVICDHQHADDTAPIKAAANSHHLAQILAALGITQETAE